MRQSTTSPVLQRKAPSEELGAATPIPAARETRRGAAPNHVPVVIDNLLPYVDVISQGATNNNLSPMTERRTDNDTSLSNTTISTIMVLKNAKDLDILTKRDDESVDGGGCSDAEGEGGIEMILIKDAVQDTAIERRVNDNANIEENLHDLVQLHKDSPRLS